jgi:hypothetical protein
MLTKILAALVICAAAAAPVMAGEIKGNGGYIEQRAERGASDCKYSGLNDAYIDEDSPEYPELCSGVRYLQPMVSAEWCALHREEDPPQLTSVSSTLSRLPVLSV